MTISSKIDMGSLFCRDKLGRRLAVIREVLKADIQGMRDTLE